jgi:hypothetical protein
MLEKEAVFRMVIFTDVVRLVRDHRISPILPSRDIFSCPMDYVEKDGPQKITVLYEQGDNIPTIMRTSLSRRLTLTASDEPFAMIICA